MCVPSGDLDGACAWLEPILPQLDAADEPSRWIETERAKTRLALALVLRSTEPERALILAEQAGRFWAADTVKCRYSLARLAQWRAVVRVDPLE